MKYIICKENEELYSWLEYRCFIENIINIIYIVDNSVKRTSIAQGRQNSEAV